MSNGIERKPIIFIIISLIVGYGVATAQHYFTNEAMNRNIENMKGDIKQLQGGREAIEKRANRLEAQVYVYQGIDSMNRGDSPSARRYLGNAATFFENGALKNNPDHSKIVQLISTTRSAPTVRSMVTLCNEMAKLTPAISAVSGGAGQ
jgi:hypothetical protein